MCGKERQCDESWAACRQVRLLCFLNECHWLCGRWCVLCQFSADRYKLLCLLNECHWLCGRWCILCQFSADRFKLLCLLNECRWLCRRCAYCVNLVLIDLTCSFRNAGTLVQCCGSSRLKCACTHAHMKTVMYTLVYTQTHTHTNTHT